LKKKEITCLELNVNSNQIGFDGAEKLIKSIVKSNNLGKLTLNMRNVGCHKDDVTFLKNKLYHGKLGKPFVSLKLLA